LLFFSMLAMYFSVQKKFIWAGLMAACAAMAKGTGILICGAVILICVFLFFWGKEYRFKPRVLWGAVVAFSFLIGKYYSTFHILHHGTEKASYLVGFFLGWKENKCLPVLYLCGASFLLFAGVYLKEQFRKQTKNLAEYVHKNYTVFVGMVFMLAWWGLFIHSYAAIYRYRLLLVPFSLFCVFYMVQYLVRNKNIITGLLGAAVVFSFWGSYGYLYKKEDVIIQYVGERSLEYRIDLKLQMEIARKIEREFSNYTVGAPFVMAQALAFPEYGYVSKKMDVMMYDFPAGYGGIREYKPLQKDELLRTIWIGFKTHIPYEEKKVIEYYPYGPGDQMIEEWMWGMKKGVLFRGGQYIERKYLLRQLKIREYLKHHGHRE
ncbi:MAG: hypothetical protein KC618_03975, partial [Candidatus Omnitrophica bacterium]|nr:hypothetical protein [Candidatus Omnitrophota bacterium]